MIFSIIGLIVIFPLIMALAILINKEFSDPGFYRSLRVIRYGSHSGSLSSEPYQNGEVSQKV